METSNASANGSVLARRRFLKLIGAGATGGMLGMWGCAAPARREAQRADTAKRPPNIVLILVDDLGWTDPRCYGSDYHETPNIDRLCAQGMKFTNAYAAAACCSPSRAAVMTGRYPARSGITDVFRWRDYKPGMVIPEWRAPEMGGSLKTPFEGYYLDLDEITIAEALRTAGYRSCHVGKWHLGNEPWSPNRQGFDVNHGGYGAGKPPSYFDPYWNEAVGCIPTLPPRKEGEYLTDREADEAVQFIRDSRDGPFFLYMSHYAVHEASGPDQEWFQGKPDLVQRYRDKPRGAVHKNAKYAAMVHSLDDSTGRILDTLDEFELSDNTIVIFASDNGTWVAASRPAPLRESKGWPYEGGIRVPTVIRWPGVTRPGSTCDSPIISMDFFPTILAAAGVPLPSDRAIDGLDLRQVLDQTGSLNRDALYWHAPHYRLLRSTDGAVYTVSPNSAIRCGDWKLIRYYETRGQNDEACNDAEYELFNLKDDLSETTNLAEREPRKLAELKARLEAWLEAVNARLPEKP